MLFLGIALGASAQDVNGGLLYASDFGRWQLPQGNSPTSGMIQWPNSSICSVTSGGFTFAAVKIGRPLKIVDVNPAQSEVVTPTSVHINNSTCTVTAPMSFTHLAYTVQSGTAGLQEAIDYATVGSQQQQVVLTPAWRRIGGTSDMITAAAGNVNVSILDQRSSRLVPYLWNGNQYVAGAFPSGAAGVSLQIQGNVNGALAGLNISTDNSWNNLLVPGFVLLGGDPTAPLQAATKQYVDAGLGNTLPANGATSSGAGISNVVTFPGAVGARTLDSIVSVIGYGADPTGTNDSTTAISNALANSSGFSVHIPAGTYKITGSLTMPVAGQILYGDGQGKTVLNWTGACGSMSLNVPVGSQIVVMNNNNQTVRDLTIQASSSSVCQTQMVTMVSGLSNRTLEHTQLLHSHAIAVYAMGGTSDRILNNDIEDFFYGIQPGGSTRDLIQGNTLLGGWHASGQIPPWTSINVAGGKTTSDTAKLNSAGSGYTTANGLALSDTSGHCATSGTINITAVAGAVSSAYPNIYMATQPTGCQVGDVLNIVQGGNTTASVKIIGISGSLYWDGVLGEGSADLQVLGNHIEDVGQSGVYFGGNNTNAPNAVVSNNTVKNVRNFSIDIGVSTPGNTVANTTVTGNLAIDGMQGQCHFVGITGATISGNTCIESSSYLGYWGMDAAPTGRSMNQVQGDVSTAPLSNNTVTGNTFQVADSIYNAYFVQSGTGTGNQVRDLNNNIGTVKVGTNMPVTIGSSPTSLGRTRTDVYPMYSSTTPSLCQTLGTWTAPVSTGSFASSLNMFLHTGNSFGTGNNNMASVVIDARMGNNTTAPNLTGASFGAIVPQANNTVNTPITAVWLVDHSGGASTSNGAWDVVVQQVAGGTGMYAVSYDSLDTWAPLGTAVTCPSGASSTVLVATNMGSAAYSGLASTFTAQNTFNAGTNSQKFQTATTGDTAAISILDSSGVLQGKIGSAASDTAAFSLRFSGGNMQLNAASVGGLIRVGNDRQTIQQFSWTSGINTTSYPCWNDGTSTACIQPTTATRGNYTWTLPAFTGTFAMTSQLPQAGTVTSASGLVTTAHTFGTAFTSTPVCQASPYSNAGAWYFSTLPSTTSSGVITYATSGAQTFSVTCNGPGGAW